MASNSREMNRYYQRVWRYARDVGRPATKAEKDFLKTHTTKELFHIVNFIDEEEFYRKFILGTEEMI